MTTHIVSFLEKENVVRGDLLTKPVRLEGKTAEDLVALARSSSVSGVKSVSTPRSDLSDTNRRALGNVGNSARAIVPTSNEGQKPIFRVPQIPESVAAKNLFANPKPVVVEPPEEDFPEIENMPACLDDDDYEDIWPKIHRLSAEELDYLATWRPILPDVKDCVFEPDPHPLFEYEDAYEPIPGYCGSRESFCFSDLLDSSPMEYVPPLSPVS